MVEYLIILNLVLGVIGTLTGISALIINYKTHRKNRAIIRIEKVLGNINKENEQIEFEILLHNEGNISTEIYKIEAFIDNYCTRPHLLKLSEEVKPTFSDALIIPKKEGIPIPFTLNSNSTMKIRIQLSLPTEEIFNKIVSKLPINSKIIFYFTNGFIEKKLYIGEKSRKKNVI